LNPERAEGSVREIKEQKHCCRRRRVYIASSVALYFDVPSINCTLVALSVFLWQLLIAWRCSFNLVALEVIFCMLVVLGVIYWMGEHSGNTLPRLVDVYVYHSRLQVLINSRLSTGYSVLMGIRFCAKMLSWRTPSGLCQ
jgi:hypothetical protein